MGKVNWHKVYIEGEEIRKTICKGMAKARYHGFTTDEEFATCIKIEITEHFKFVKRQIGEEGYYSTEAQRVANL